MQHIQSVVAQMLVRFPETRGNAKLLDRKLRERGHFFKLGSIKAARCRLQKENILLQDEDYESRIKKSGYYTKLKKRAHAIIAQLDHQIGEECDLFAKEQEEMERRENIYYTALGVVTLVSVGLFFFWLYEITKL